MANEVEIRITGRDASAAALAAARFGMQRVEVAATATRRATTALAEADARLTVAQAAAASVAERLARGQLTEAEAANQAAQAGRELERATLAQAAAHRVAAAAADHQAAQERELARACSRAAREADTSGNLFKRMFKSLENAGTSSVDAVSKGMESLASASPVMVAGIIAGLFALPAAAVGVGAVITLALGGALTAVGIMAVKGNTQVKKSFSDLKTHVVSELGKLAAPFVPMLTHIATVFSGTFDKLAPSLKSAFSQMAPSISHFGDMFGQSLTRLGPTITAIAAEFAPLISQLGDAMPAIMNNLASGIESIVSAAAGHEGDIASFVVSLSKIVAVGGDVVTALASIYDTAKNFASFPDNPWSFIKDAIPPLNVAVGLWNSVKGVVGGSAKGWDEASQASWDAQTGIKAASDSMNLASTSAQALKTALDELSGGQLGARAAARDFQAAIDDMNTSLKKNGHTFDIHTAKGRANQAALDKIASSGIAASEALKKTDSSGQASAKSMNDTRTAFINAAMAGGRSRDAAIKLADAMGLVATRANAIPGKTETKVLGDIHDLQSKVDAAKAKLKTVPPSKRAALLADIRDLQNKVAAAKRDLASIQNKDVTVTTHYVSNVTHAMKATGGNIGGMASGGNARGAAESGSAMTLVGEAGRELVRLPYGSTVIPHGQTESMLADMDDDDYDGLEDGFASGGVVSRKRRKRKPRKKRQPRLAADVSYAYHGGPGPTGAYNWNVSDSIKNKLSSKQTKLVAPPPHVPNWWHGQADTNFGPGGAHFQWGGPRPENVAGTPQAQRLTTAEIEKNAQAAIEKRVAAVVAAALKAHKPVITIHSNGSDHSDYLLELLRKAIRAKGGDVQVILGK